MAFVDERGDSRGDERRFRGFVEHRTVGAGGFGAGVDDRGAGGAKRIGACESGIEVAADAVAGERVVGQVEDAHNVGSIEERERVRSRQARTGLSARRSNSPAGCLTATRMRA